MPVSSFFLILNPAADRGRAARVEAPISTALRGAGVEHRIVRTRRSGHAVELAEQAVQDAWEAVVAVGGDGLVHEVANGLVRASPDRPTIPMGVVAVGSGNDFAKLLHPRPPRPREAVARLLRAEPTRVDLGRVIRMEAEELPPGEWYFTNGIGLGFDASVAIEAARIRRLRGAAIYAAAVLRVLKELSFPSVIVTLDGRQVADQPVVLTTIANGPCHGGAFWLCPDARPDDGELDVLIADARPLGRLLTSLPRVLSGRHVGREGNDLHRGRHVVITTSEPMPIHADGEIVGSGVRELEVRVEPGRLTILK